MLLRILFLPEIGRVLSDARRSAAAVAALAAAARPEAAGGANWRRALAPGRRIAGALGLALAAAGAVLAMFGIQAFLASVAAQTIDPGIFGAADQATRDILAFLADTSGTALGEMLFVFNSGVLVLAGFLLVWHTIAGTVDTAREGRFGFGGWETLRIVAAVALMAPLPGGLNAAQHAVTGLARLGGDFANAIWTPFSAQVLGYGAPVAPGPRAGAWRTAIARTLVAETCMHVANAQAAATGDPSYVRIRRENTRTAMVQHYDGDGRGLPGDLCGRISFDGVYDDSHLSSPSTGIARPGPAGLAAWAHRDALESLVPAIRDLARDLGDRFVASAPSYGQPLPDPGRALDDRGIATAYRQVLDIRLRRAASEEQRALQDAVAEDAENASWLAAASFFNTIAARTGQFQAAALAAPSAALPLPVLEQWSPQAAAAVNALTAALARSAYQPVPFAAGTGTGSAVPMATGADQGLVNKLFEFIDLDSVVLADSGNPIADLAAFGHSLVSASLLGIGTLTAAATGTGLLESVPLIGGGLNVFEHAWQVTDAFISTILGLLLIAGIALAYLLPAIPFIRFLFGILAWLIQVAAALLAVTVFAAAHVTRGDGNRLTTQATRQGWLFLPALLVRPPLMLFGLILGYFLFVAVIGLFNDIWLPLLRDTSASDGLGPVSYLTYLAIYTMVAYALINACFKMIDLLPSAVMNWIGGGAGAGDDEAGRLGGVAAAGIGRLSTLRVGSGRIGGRGRPPLPVVGAPPPGGGNP